MTRKDYVRIAESLKIDRKFLASDSEKDGFDIAVNAVADALKADNVKFDRQRFMAAVGAEL